MNTTNDHPDKIPAKTATGIEYLDFSKIIYINADHNETLVYNAGEPKPLKSSFSISEFEEMLPQKFFFKCHRSTIINLTHRVRFLNKDKCLQMTDDHKVIVAEDRLNEFYTVTGTPRRKKK